MEAAHADQALDRRGRNSNSGRRPCSNTFVGIDPDHQSVCRRRHVRCHGAAAAASLQERLGATIVVENRPGASASIGAAVVAKSPPDGSTWLLTSETFLSIDTAAHQSALRCAEGFRAGDNDRARADGAVRASLADLPHTAGARRRGEGQARYADLWHDRARQQRAHHGGGACRNSPASGSCMCPIGAPRRC